MTNHRMPDLFYIKNPSFVDMGFGMFESPIISIRKNTQEINPQNRPCPWVLAVVRIAFVESVWPYWISPYSF